MSRYLLIGFALASLLAGPLPAETITLFNTGVDASGTPLVDGTIGDPHYTLQSVPSGGTTQIRVRTSSGGFPIGPWVGDDSLSAWIGPNGSNDLNGPYGDYIYRTTFDLPGPGTVAITGQWSADNSGLNILVNNAVTGNTASEFTSWYSFTISDATGVQGANTLDFVVHNDSPTSNPTGLRVEISSAQFTPVPEPSMLALLLGTAVTGLLACARRRRTSA